MGALVLTGVNHGNGFLNTGLLDDDISTPLDSKATVTFARRGTYPYICLVHPGMVGEVVVH
jgi:plastocyanin